LAKAVRLLEEDKSPCVDDVSHIVANLLKHEYQNHPMFETFISICGLISKNFKQTIFACLTPPKTSTKARFMNLHRLVKWSEKLLIKAKIFVHKNLCLDDIHLEVVLVMVLFLPHYEQN
jgi:hypothetical protein